MPKSVSAVMPKTGAKFLDAKEKRALAEARTPLTITEIRNDPNHSYRGKNAPRWVVTVAKPDGELRALSFGHTDYRNTMFGNMADDIANGEEFTPVILVLQEGDGNSYWTFADAASAESTDAPTTKASK